MSKFLRGCKTLVKRIAGWKENLIEVELLWLLFICFDDGSFRRKAVENDASNQ